MKNINFKKIVINYVLLALAITVSGVLTYGGIINIYPDPSYFVKAIFVFLIVVYTGMIFVFWELWGEFLNLTNRVFFDFFKISILSIIVIALVFFTSTIFNIVFISGPVVVNREISNNVLELKLQIKSDLEERKKDLKERINILRRYSKRAGEYKKIESDSGKEHMFYSYQELYTRINVIINELDSKYYEVKKEKRNSPMKLVSSYLQENSYKREDSFKFDIFSGALDIVESDLYAENNDEESKETNSLGLSTPEEYGKPLDDEVSSSDDIIKESKDSGIGEYINTSSSAMKNIAKIKTVTSDTVEIKHRKFNTLINNIQSAMLEKESESSVDLSIYNGLLLYINERIDTFNKLPNYKTSELSIRKNNLYNFLNELKISINKEKIKESSNKEFDYKKYQLNDIFYSVFDKKYRELPLITFSFFIDYIPILLMLIASIIFKVRKKGKLGLKSSGKVKV